MGKTSRRITLLQINDTHGYLEPHPELFWKGSKAVYRTAGGFARIKTLFNRIRRECNGAVMAFDNGDTFHGTYVAVQSKGEALIKPINALELDAWTVHWDFAYGVPRAKEIAAKLNHPLLAINCYEKSTGERPFKASTVIERGGVRVGVIGVAATILDKTMPPHFSEGVRFTLGNEELPEAIRALREEERVDVVVVLSHLGFPQDVKLAGEVQGIDVLLSGHTHNRMEEPLIVNGTAIIQSGCHGSFVGRLDIEVAGSRVHVARHELITVDDTIEPDREMQRLVEEAVSPHRVLLNTIVGNTETALNRNTILESTMDNFLLDAIAAAAGTPIAFSNGWRYGAPVAPGPITVGDLWNIIPPNPPVSLVDMTGHELREMIEENLENSFAADPYRQMGGYVKRCRGVSIYIKIENPKGSRVQEVFVEDERLEPQKTYAVAFVTTQGVPPGVGKHRRDLAIDAIQAMRSLVETRGTVRAEFRGTVIAI